MSKFPCTALSSVDVVPLRLSPPPCTGKFILRDEAILFYASSMIKSCKDKGQRKTGDGCCSMDSFVCGFETRGFASQTVSPRRRISSHGITQPSPMFCLCLSLCSFVEYKLKSCTTGSDASCTAQLFYFLMQSVNVGFNLVYIVKKFGFVAGLIN